MLRLKILFYSKSGLRYDIWWGNSARTKYFSGVAKPVTAENSGHSNNQLIGNLLNTPILRKMDSSDYFFVNAHPHQLSYLIPALLFTLQLFSDYSSQR
jgi:hypothetical protein